MPDQDEINIPADELGIRSRYEMKKSDAWVIECSRVSSGTCDLASYLLLKNGFKSILVLDRGAEGAFCQTTPTF